MSIVNTLDDNLGNDITKIYLEYISPDPDKVKMFYDSVMRAIGHMCDKCGGIDLGDSQGKVFHRIKDNTHRPLCHSCVCPRVSGFMRPAHISPEMEAFFSLPPGREWPRVRITKFIFDYIKVNYLYNDTTRRIIIPNAALTALLGPFPSDEPLDYFNLHSYIARHFIPLHPPVAPSSTYIDLDESSEDSDTSGDSENSGKDTE